MRSFLIRTGSYHKNLVLRGFCAVLGCEAAASQKGFFAPLKKPARVNNDSCAESVRIGVYRKRSALTLLVLRVLADDHDSALALDDLALLAHGLHGRSNFH